MNIQWFPGHMAKARREIEEQLRVVDIVFVLLDARIPYSSQNPMMNDILAKKPMLIIFTKFDMADVNETKKWERHFTNSGKTVLPVDSISGFNVKKIESVSKEILKEKIEKDLKKGLKPRALRAMIVGIPNVGKSTLINRLAGKKAANVGNMPGVTKAQQWVRLSKNLEMLDTPGILWPKFEEQSVGINLALTGAIKDEILPKEDLAFHLLDFLKKYYLSLLMERYSLDNECINVNSENNSNVVIIERILQNRGIKITEYERGYDILLNDFKNGRIGKVTLDRL